MDPVEFIGFARKLMVLPAAHSQAGYRSVTSRLYYGIYHETLEFIQKELGFFHRKREDNENKHLFILEYLIGSDEERALDLASQIRQMHQRRKEADYDLATEPVGREAHALESVSRADRILRALEECRLEPVRARIQAGMSLYRKRRSPHAP